MKVATHAAVPVAGQLTARQAKMAAHAAGLRDLTLNRNGVWVAYNSQYDLLRVDVTLAKQHGVI